jgi:signal transduction histidine kinase
VSVQPDPLAALERAAFAEEYAAALRHDLRNRLASIRNAAFYLSRRTQKTALWGEDPNVERLFKIIDEAAQRADESLQGRFGLDRLGARRVRRVGLREPLDLAIACARVLPTVSFALELAAGEFDGDPQELALALRCLVENAAEALGPEGGVVRIEGKPVEGGFAIAVIDQGPGVDPAEAEKIFLPLRSTKTGHVGLGLNIARRITRGYGGELSMAPTASGATFILLLPPEAPVDQGGPR